MITKNSIKDILIAVSLLERYDPDTVPSQNKIYDCFYGNIHFDDSGKRKKISSLFKEFVEVFEEPSHNHSYSLKQTSRKKYFIHFGESDIDFDSSVMEFDQMVLENLTTGKIDIPGIARDSFQLYREGFWDLIDNSYFPYLAYLFCCLSLALDKEYSVEILIDPKNIFYATCYEELPNEDSTITEEAIFIQFVPRSLILTSKFYVIGVLNDEINRNEEMSSEIRLELRDILDIGILLPQDLGKI